jgi:hypothetical protein
LGKGEKGVAVGGCERGYGDRLGGILPYAIFKNKIKNYYNIIII